VCVVIIIALAAALTTVLYLSYYNSPHQKAIRQSEINATGACIPTNTSVNSTTILCTIGERFEGFKLLSVSPSSIEILVYDDCGACMHDSTNGNQFVELINVTTGQTFGGPCMDIPQSELVSTNENNGDAMIRYNSSESNQICI
jgi:hypothetical protein